MAQNKFSFNGVTPNRQMIKVVPNFAKTSTADSGRNQLGVADNKVLFCVQAYTVLFPDLYSDDFSRLLQQVIYHDKLSFHYYNPVLGAWRTEYFYVENISSDGMTVEEGREILKGLQFQITAINPL